MFKYLWRIIIFSFIILLLGQFDVLDRTISTISIVAAILFFLITKNSGDSVKFIFTIFIISHFRIFDVFGSLAGIIAGMGLLKLYLTNSLKSIKIKDDVINFLLSVLIIFNVLGWILKSVLPMEHFVPAIISFFILIAIFNVSRKIPINVFFLNIFIYLVVFVSIYATATAVINGFNISPVETPLLGGYFAVKEDFEVTLSSAHVLMSMIGRPTGELGLIYFSFLFTLYLNYKRINSLLRINKNLLIIGILSSFILCLFEFSKSHTIGLLLSSLYILFFSGFIMKTINILPLAKLIRISIIVVIFIMLTQPLIKYDYIFARFEAQPEFLENLQKSPLKGEGTSRSDSWGLAYDYISEHNFFIGYGYANGSRNRSAWLGPDNLNYPKFDYHNLLYSLIPVFGWIGSVSFVLLFIVTIRRLWNVLRNKRFDYTYRVVCFAFFNFWIFFWFGEMSINAMSSPNYMVLIFVFLGLSNALYYNRFNFLSYQLIKK